MSESLPVITGQNCPDPAKSCKLGYMHNTLEELEGAARVHHAAKKAERAARHEVYRLAVQAVDEGQEKKKVASVAGVTRPTLDRVLRDRDEYGVF